MVACRTCPQSPNPITLRTLATHNHSISGFPASNLCCTRCNSIRIICNSLCSSQCNNLCSRQCNNLCNSRSNNPCRNPFSKSSNPCSSHSSSQCHSQCHSQCNNQCTASQWHIRRISYRTRNRRLTSALPDLALFSYLFSFNISFLTIVTTLMATFSPGSFLFSVPIPFRNAPIPITTIS